MVMMERDWFRVRDLIMGSRVGKEQASEGS